MKTPEKKKRQMKRYSDGELELIKLLFAENDDLLFAVRKLFLQAPLEPHEQIILTNTFTKVPANLAVLRKTYLPEIDPEAPIGQVVDLWLVIGSEIKERSPEAAYPHLVAREQIIAYFDQQLAALESGEFDPSKGEIQLASLVGGIHRADAEQGYINLLVRNTIIGHNEAQLQQLALLAGQKSETVEETQKRLARDGR